MGEVPLKFDVLSNKTVDVKGAKTIMIKTSGNEKMYYTVVLACCTDGTKLPPLLIFKRKTPPSQLQPLDVSVNKPFKGFMHEDWASGLRHQLITLHQQEE